MLIVGLHKLDPKVLTKGALTACVLLWLCCCRFACLQHVLQDALEDLDRAEPPGAQSAQQKAAARGGVDDRPVDKDALGEFQACRGGCFRVDAGTLSQPMLWGKPGSWGQFSDPVLLVQP